MTFTTFNRFSQTGNRHRVRPSLGLLILASSLALATPPKGAPAAGSASTGQSALALAPVGHSAGLGTPDGSSPMEEAGTSRQRFFEHGNQAQLAAMRQLWELATPADRVAISGESERLNTLLYSAANTDDVAMVEFLFNEVLGADQKSELSNDPLDLFFEDRPEDPILCAIDGSHPQVLAFWARAIAESIKEGYFRYALLSKGAPNPAAILWANMAQATKTECIARDIEEYPDYEQTLYDAAIISGSSGMLQEFYELADHGTRSFWLSEGGGLNVIEIAAEHENATALEFTWEKASAQQKQAWLFGGGFFRVAAFLARQGRTDLLQECLAMIAAAERDPQATASAEASPAPQPDAALAPDQVAIQADAEMDDAASEGSASTQTPKSPLLGSLAAFYDIDHYSKNPMAAERMAAAGEAEKDLYRKRFNDYLLTLKGVGFNYWETEALARITDDHAKFLYLLHACFDETAEGLMTEARPLAAVLGHPDPALQEKLRQLKTLKEIGINYHSPAAVATYSNLQVLSKSNPLSSLPSDLLISLCNTPEHLITSLKAAKPSAKPTAASRKRATRPPTAAPFASSSETVEQRASKKACQ